MDKAKEEHHDYVIIDTAGRLHVDSDLMDELTEIKETSFAGRNFPCRGCDDGTRCSKRSRKFQ